jgi:F0F1-type ATP synthase assembly protein I
MKKIINKLKESALLHREYVVGFVVGVVIGIIVF